MQVPWGLTTKSWLMKWNMSQDRVPHVKYTGNHQFQTTNRLIISRKNQQQWRWPSDDEDTQDYGNNNAIPSKQQENRQNRYHKTTVPTKIKPNIENSPWETVKVLSHAGKATGKYSNCWNTAHHHNLKQPIDFSKTAQWKIVEETPPPSDNQSNANQEMEIINRLSNLSLEENEIQTHETLIVQNKEKKTGSKTKRTPSVEKWEGLWGSTWSRPKLHLSEMGNQREISWQWKIYQSRTMC